MGILDSLFGSKEPETAAAPAAPAAAANGGDSAWQSLEAVQRIAPPIAAIEEDEATGEVAEIYDAVKKAMQVPAVPNIDKVLANSPQALKATVGLLGDLYMASTLPQPVVAMLLYSISLARSCQYCGSFHRLTCRMVGVDEAMLAAVGNDLGTVTPERVQAIVSQNRSRRHDQAGIGSLSST
jgi:alkylhydroperoxidase family enzyme